MDVLLIAVLLTGWLTVCAVMVALCASAKEGDGLDVPPEPSPERRLKVPAGPASLARR